MDPKFIRKCFSPKYELVKDATNSPNVNFIGVAMFFVTFDYTLDKFRGAVALSASTITSTTGSRRRTFCSETEVSDFPIPVDARIKNYSIVRYLLIVLALPFRGFKSR